MPETTPADQLFTGPSLRAATRDLRSHHTWSKTLARLEESWGPHQLLVCPCLPPLDRLRDRVPGQLKSGGPCEASTLYTLRTLKGTRYPPRASCSIRAAPHPPFASASINCSEIVLSPRSVLRQRLEGASRRLESFLITFRWCFEHIHHGFRG